jgi:hypothetical protein
MADTPNGSQAAGTQPVESDAPAHIPKERLDKEIAKRRELEAQLAQLNDWRLKVEAETKQAEEKRLAEQGQFQKLAEERAAKLADAEKRLAEVQARERDAYLKGEVRARFHDIQSPDYLQLVYGKLDGVAFEDGEWKGLDNKLEEFRKNNPALFQTGAATPHTPARNLHPVAGMTPPPESLDKLTPAQRLAYHMDAMRKAGQQG